MTYPPVRIPQKNSPGVAPQDTMAEAGRKVLRFQFARMLHHEDGTVLGEDIEELHDMRVATRRMRAGYDVFEEAYCRPMIEPYFRGLRATGKALGRVRDLDVFMEKARLYLETLLEVDRGGLDPLLDAWSREREAAREQMIAYLNSKRYRKFKQEFGAFLAAPGADARIDNDENFGSQQVSDIAPNLIHARLEAVYAFEPLLANPTIEHLHALRIEFKRLRYTIEFFREILTERAEECIDIIKVLQDHLGDLHDAVVATAILEEFIENWAERHQSIQPVTAYLDVKRDELNHLIEIFPDAWAIFTNLEFNHILAL
ncbi:MAG: CHAD domain-containing protein [Chloroflexi bacterium]|nr:CHAD domain-containing protein [Chloroflexota bacterium]MBU1660145.1 CHAD domain-containing protein [Chloroflexota bacterium]